MRATTCLTAIALLAGLTIADIGAQSQAAPRTIRRVVTGNRPDGKSFVVSDTRVPAANTTPNVFHANAAAPLGIGVGGDGKVRPFEKVNIDLGQGGTGVHFWEFPPTPAPTTWHRTATMDYDMVIGGELVLLLDEGEVTLHPGDVLIQRNTHHSWRNPGKIAATVWVVNVALAP